MNDNRGPRTATCPEHGVRSQDFVGENSKKNLVFRCKQDYPKDALNKTQGAHYFTVDAPKLGGEQPVETVVKRKASR